jgi:hypothetical protein
MAVRGSVGSFRPKPATPPRRGSTWPLRREWPASCESRLRGQGPRKFCLARSQRPPTRFRSRRASRRNRRGCAALLAGEASRVQHGRGAKAVATPAAARSPPTPISRHSVGRSEPSARPGHRSRAAAGLSGAARPPRLVKKYAFLHKCWSRGLAEDRRRARRDQYFCRGRRGGRPYTAAWGVGVAAVVRPTSHRRLAIRSCITC